MIKLPKSGFNNLSDFQVLPGFNYAYMNLTEYSFIPMYLYPPLGWPLPLSLKITGIEAITGPTRFNLYDQNGAGAEIVDSKGATTWTISSVTRTVQWVNWEGNLILANYTSNGVTPPTSETDYPPTPNDKRYAYGVVTDGSTILNVVPSYNPGKLYNNQDYQDIDIISTTAMKQTAQGHQLPMWTTDPTAQASNNGYFVWTACDGKYNLLNTVFFEGNYLDITPVDYSYTPSSEAQNYKFFKLPNGTVITGAYLTSPSFANLSGYDAFIPIFLNAPDGQNLSIPNLIKIILANAQILTITGIDPTQDGVNPEWPGFSTNVLWRGYKFGSAYGGTYKRWPDQNDLYNFGIGQGPDTLTIGDIKIDKTIIDLTTDDPTIKVTCDDDTWWAVFDVNEGIKNFKGSGSYTVPDVKINWTENQMVVTNINGYYVVLLHGLKGLDPTQYDTFVFTADPTGDVIKIPVHTLPSGSKLFVVYADKFPGINYYQYYEWNITAYQQTNAYPIQFDKLVVSDGDTLTVTVKPNTGNTVLKYAIRIGTQFFQIVQGYQNET